jgi:multidrug resistance efflux pump
MMIGMKASAQEPASHARGSLQGKWLLFGGVVVLLAVAAGAVVWWRNQQPGGQPTVAPPPTAFTGDQISLPGKVQAVEVVPVAAPIDGLVQEFLVDVGDEVSAGQLIARIRNSKLDAAVEAATAEVEKLKARQTNLEGAIIAARLEASRAEAEASRAKTEFERLDKVFQRQSMLMREGATPRLAFEKAQREFQQAKADHESLGAVAKAAAERIESMQKDLDSVKKLLESKTEEMESAREDASGGDLTSPVDGLVVGRQGAVGEETNPTVENFFRIAVNLTVMQVEVEPPPPVLAKIKAGQAAMIHIAEAPDDVPGTVREVAGQKAIVEFVSPTAAIKPGVSAQVTIKFNESGPPIEPRATADPKQ